MPGFTQKSSTLTTIQQTYQIKKRKITHVHLHMSFVNAKLKHRYYRADRTFVFLSTPLSKMYFYSLNHVFYRAQFKGKKLTNTDTLPSFEDSADFATAIIFVDGV